MTDKKPTSTGNGKTIETYVTNPNESIPIKEESLIYLKKAVDFLKNAKDDQGYMLMQERFLYMAADYLSNPSNKTNICDFNAEAGQFLEKMNRKSVEAFNVNNLDDAARIISRIVDFLNQKNITKLFTNQNRLDEARILTYNNLSCIYRKIGKLPLALKTVSLAISLEEKLVAENFGNSAISIISTYLNKSAILSEMKRHDKSIESVLKGLKFLQTVEQRSDLNDSEKNHLKQLNMLSYYNLGVEYEHLEDRDKAISNYEKAVACANEIGKPDIKAKIEKALNNLKK